MKWLSKIISFLLKVLLAFIIPFVLLIRGSVFLHLHYQWNTWLALTAAGLGTVLLLWFYLYFIVSQFQNKSTPKKFSKRAFKLQIFSILLMVGFFCGYNLIFLSTNNAKTQKIKGEFTMLHPLLRIGIGTVLFLDKELLITDLSRTHQDYRNMGMKVLNNSLHYVQKDGYVHAMDLRTSQRHELRNWCLKLYFQLMGFSTLRHDQGTGDHLHISIPTHESPKAL